MTVPVMYEICAQVITTAAIIADIIVESTPRATQLPLPIGAKYWVAFATRTLIIILSYLEIAVKLLSDDCHRPLLMKRSTLVQVMAWCHPAPSHYLSQY